MAKSSDEKAPDAVLIDWERQEYYDILDEKLILDEPILMIRALMTNKKLFTNYMTGFKASLETVTNWMGIQRYTHFEKKYYAQEYKYSNLITYNWNLIKTFDRKRYETFSPEEEGDTADDEVPQETYPMRVWMAPGYPLDFQSIFDVLEALILLMPEPFNQIYLRILHAQTPLLHLCSKKN